MKPALLLALLVICANPASPASISLSPTNGPPGRAVSVSVKGWPASVAGQGVLISFDGQPLGQSSVRPCENQNDAAGFGLLCDGAPVNIVVPNVNAGPHVISATVGAANLSVQGTFLVGPDVALQTQSGRTAPGHVVRGALFPPQQPEPDDDTNPALQPLPEGPYIPRRDSQPMTVAGSGNFAAMNWTASPAAPTDPIKLITNIGLGDAGEPPDPSTTSSGRVVLSTANTYLGFSTDCGQTFAFIDPTTVFPNDADGGLCCDQVVQYAPQIDRFIWLMQFWPSPRTSCNANRYRIAVASPADVISSGATAWTYWDLTSGDLGLTSFSQFMDYPDLVISANSFYITANLPCTNGKLIARSGLSNLIAPGAPGLPFDVLVQDSPAYRMAQNCDTRAYWAGLVSSSKIRLFYWDEGAGDIHVNDYDMPSSPIFGGADYQSLVPGGVDWLSFGGPPRNMPATGARVGNQIWFAWNAGRDPSSVSAGRRIPHPRIDLIKFDATSFALLEYLPIWNATHAFAYAALGVNSDDEVGFSFAWGGGGIYYPSPGVGILTGSIFLQNTYTSTASSGRYGDYGALRRHYPETRLFSAAGYGVKAVTGGLNYDLRYVLFGRSSVPAPVCLIPVGSTGGHISFEIAGEPGEKISVQGSHDLSHWTELLNTTLQSRTFQFTNTPSPNFNGTFYRVCVPAPQN